MNNTPNLRLIEGGAGKGTEVQNVSSTRKELEDALKILGAERKDGKLFLSFDRETMIKKLKKEGIEVADDISEKELADNFLNLVVNPWLKVLVGENSTAELLKIEPKRAASNIANAA